MNVNDPRWASIDAFVEENRDNILRDIAFSEKALASPPGALTNR